MDATFLDQSIFQNTIRGYMLALGVSLAGIVAVSVARRVILSRLADLSARAGDSFRDYILSQPERSLFPLLYLAAVYVGLRTLSMTDGVTRLLHVVMLLLFTFYAVRFVGSLAGFALERHIRKRRTDEDAVVARAFMPVIYAALWAAGIIFLLDNLGFKVSTMVAGLGIGGLAVAMASKTVLEDLFSYLAILMDRPFEIGDFVIVGEFMGNVEHIGIKTTRLRSLGGEELVFSNTDLTNSRVRNYKRMEKRRVLFRFGVTYQTTAEQLRKIPDLVREVVEAQDLIEFDRAHFASFGDSSLDFEVVYYVLTREYNTYMDRQQAINLGIKHGVEAMGAEFAYPTRTLFMAGREAGEA